VAGDVSFDITCTDRLAISGAMVGAEGGGATFASTVDGEYNSATDALAATLDGTINLIGSIPYSLDFSGDLDGQLAQTSPYTMNGVWQIQAPMPLGNGTGSGTWMAELQ